MRRTEFEKQARKFWSDALRSAGRQPTLGDKDVERLVVTTVALAYAEKLLDQERKL